MSANSTSTGQVPVQRNESNASCVGPVPDKKNYTLKEAAVFLNVSTRTVERLIERKLIRRNKALRKILIPRAELERFLEKTL